MFADLHLQQRGFGAPGNRTHWILLVRLHQLVPNSLSVCWLTQLQLTQSTQIVRAYFALCSRDVHHDDHVVPFQNLVIEPWVRH